MKRLKYSPLGFARVNHSTLGNLNQATGTPRAVHFGMWHAHNLRFAAKIQAYPPSIKLFYAAVIGFHAALISFHDAVIGFRDAVIVYYVDILILTIHFLRLHP